MLNNILPEFDKKVLQISDFFFKNERMQLSFLINLINILNIS